MMRSRDGRVRMCGFGPAVAMLTATKKLGAAFSELVKYATSGDVSSNRDMGRVRGRCWFIR